MKKLLLLIFTVIPLLGLAQTNFTPQFKRNIPADSLLGYSVQGVTGNHWLPDTSWVRKYVGGAFIKNSSSLQSGAQFRIGGTGRAQKLIADSDIYLRTTTKKPWFSDYAVLNMAGDAGIRTHVGAHEAMMYNNLYAVGTAFTDFKYANNGPASYVYLGNTGALAFGAAPSGTAGTSATVTDWLKIDVNGHAFLPGLRDTTVTDSIVGYKNHQLYKIPFSGGGGGSFLPLTLTGDATVNQGAHSLLFNAHSGTDSTAVSILPTAFSSDSYDSVNQYETLTQSAANGADFISSDLSGPGTSFVGTNAITGTSAFLITQSTSGTSGIKTDTAKILFFDGLHHIGPLADANIDTAKMTTHPKAYVTSEWVMGKIAGGSGSFVPVSTGTSPVFNAILNDGVNGISIGTGNGSRGYQLYMNQSDTAFFGTFRSTSSKRIGLHIDSLNAFFVNTENHKPLKYEGVSFGLLTDSSLVPKRYVDSLTAGGGSGAVVLNPSADQTVDISTNSTIFQGDGHVFGVNGYLTISPQALQSFYTDTATAYTAFLTVTPAGNGLQYGINQSIGGAPNEQSMSIDTFRGTFWKDTRFHRGIDLQGVNFSAFRDSTLIPKAYAIHLIDSLSSGGGTTTHPLTLGYGILGTSFNGATAVTAKADSSVLQTIANFHPLGNTFWVPLARTVAGFALSSNITLGTLTLGNGLTGSSYNPSGATTAKADTSILQTVLNFFPKGDTRYAKIASLPTAANPTASIGFTAVNGSATTYMRSDAAPPLSQAIVPTWTGLHTFTGSLRTSGSITATTGASNTATSVIGANFNAAAATYTDNSTASSTTLTYISANVLQAPTFAASNTGLVYNNAATLFIGGPPVAGTNVTLSSPSSIFVNSGISIFQGGIGTSTSSISNIFSNTSTSISSPTANAQLQFAGSSGINYRTVFNGNTSTVLTANNNVAMVAIGSSPFTSATSGTTAFAVNLLVNPLGTYTPGLASLTNTASLYVGSASSAGTNNYSIYSAGGNINFQGLSASLGVATDANKNLISVNFQTKPHTIFTPTTGGTVALVTNQYNIINPTGALLALTVNLPSSPTNNDCVFIKFTQNVTTVTYGNGTVVDGITSPISGGLVVLTYDGGSASWY